jgi:hypothetical protein
MSLLTNSIRPQHKSVSVSGPAYSAYKLMGSCSRCSSRTYQTTNMGHPIFKMVCPDCRAYLTELKQQAARRNEEARMAQLASKK